MNSNLEVTCLRALYIVKNSVDSLGEEGRKEEYKPGENLTKSDLQVSKDLTNFFLNSNLSAIYCSEEAGILNPDVKNPKYDIFWDEIDGTFNYQRGGLLPSTIVVSAFNHKPKLTFDDAVFAAVMDLKSKDLWYAKKQGGCFFNNKKVKPSKLQELGRDFYLFLDQGPCPSIEEQDKFKKIKSLTWPHNISSAGFHLASVASGNADAFVGPHQKAHELGAGYLLLKEAGAFIKDFEGNELANQEFDFNKKYKIITAGNETLGNELLKLL